MIPLIAKLFGAGETAETGMKIAEKATDGIIAGIDKSFYTQEEKAIAAKAVLDLQLDFIKTFAGENSEQSKARRELAKMVFKSYFSLIFMCVAVWGFNAEYAKFIFDITVGITWLTTSVAVAYFGPHQLSKVFQWKKK